MAYVVVAALVIWAVVAILVSVQAFARAVVKARDEEWEEYLAQREASWKEGENG